MNSYPVELLGQHAPLMFVAGLTEPTSPTPASPPTSPQQALRASLDVPPSDGPGETTGSNVRQDSFSVLTARLRAALATRTKGVVWDPDRAKSFQVVLVDKVRLFPNMKLNRNQLAFTRPSAFLRAKSCPHQPSHAVMFLGPPLLVNLLYRLAQLILHFHL